MRRCIEQARNPQPVQHVRYVEVWLRGDEYPRVYRNARLEDGMEQLEVWRGGKRIAVFHHDAVYSWDAGEEDDESDPLPEADPGDTFIN